MGLSRLISVIVNFLITITASVVLGLGIWLKTRNGGEACLEYLSTPIIVVSAVILVVAIVGFIGAYNNNACLLWVYAFLMFISLVLLLAFTIFAFVVTNEKAAETVSNKGIAQYKLGDYSTWLQKRVNSTTNWAKIKACLYDSKVCNAISKLNSTQALESAKLSSIVDGCCLPPTICNFTFVNSTYWILPANISASSNHDCNIWSNQEAIACYNCDSCKAGVLENVRSNWRRVAIANLVLFVILLIIYSVSCCAYRSSLRKPSGYSRGF